MSTETSAPEIVLLERHAVDPGDNPLDAIDALGNVTRFDRTPQDGAAEVVARAAAASILVINKVRLSANVLRQLPKLRLVCVTATGYDSVDVAAAKEQGVVVCNVPEYSTNAVAQHVFALVLTLCRRPQLHDAEIRSGVWNDHDEFCFWSTPQIDLAGKTMGIVGMGRIGTRVAEIATALGMHVVANSRRMNAKHAYPGFRWLALPTLFTDSDIVSLHCPLDDTTREMIDLRLLSCMRRSAFLINTARGGLIVESDLAAALAKGSLAAAALDTVTREPIESTNPILSAPNCLLTPHLAWATLAARQKLVVETAANISAFLANRPRNVVSS